MWPKEHPLWSSQQTESPVPWSCPRLAWETRVSTTASWETHSGTRGAAPVQYLPGGRKAAAAAAASKEPLHKKEHKPSGRGRKVKEE